MGQWRGKGPTKEFESFQIGQMPEVFIAGESERDDGRIHNTVNLFVKGLKPHNYEEERKKLEDFFYQSDNSNTVEKERPSMGSH